MENKNTQRVSKLGRFSLLTLFAVYFLIFVGGVVRSTGSGMGCPDWPKCFGSWVPPTRVSELPDNYKQIYSEKRAVKNKRLANYMSSVGFDELADKIENDKSILEEADFNATKTWIEYVNRLIGVLIGLFIIVTFYLSTKYWSKDKVITLLGLGSLLLVVFQGWVGSLVVSTNLIPFMVTIHMLIALLIVALLCWMVTRTNSQFQLKIDNKAGLNLVLVVSMVILIIQIVLGTQVREMVDEVAVAFNYMSRGSWVENLGVDFLIHRSFSWLVLLIHVALGYKLYQNNLLTKVTKSLFFVIILTIGTGVIMAYFSIPAFLQPMHLLLGTMGFGLQIFLFLQLNSKPSLAV